MVGGLSLSGAYPVMQCLRDPGIANRSLVTALAFGETGDQSQICVSEVDDAVFAQVEAGQHPVEALDRQWDYDNAVEPPLRVPDRTGK